MPGSVTVRAASGSVRLGEVLSSSFALLFTTGPVPFASRVRDGRLDGATTGWIWLDRSLIDGSFGIGMIVGGVVPGRACETGAGGIATTCVVFTEIAIGGGGGAFGGAGRFVITAVRSS